MWADGVYSVVRSLPRWDVLAVNLRQVSGGMASGELETCGELRRMQAESSLDAQLNDDHRLQGMRS